MQHLVRSVHWLALLKSLGSTVLCSAILHVAVWSLIRVQVVRLFETRNTDENSVVLVIVYLASIVL